MNIKNLDRLIHALKTELIQFDMSTEFDYPEELSAWSSLTVQHTCDSAGCLAGLAAVLSAKPDETLEETQLRATEPVLEDFLEIDSSTAQSIFWGDPSIWQSPRTGATGAYLDRTTEEALDVLESLRRQYVS